MLNIIFLLDYYRENYFYGRDFRFQKHDFYFIDRILRFIFFNSLIKFIIIVDFFKWDNIIYNFKFKLLFFHFKNLFLATRHNRKHKSLEICIYISNSMLHWFKNETDNDRPTTQQRQWFNCSATYTQIRKKIIYLKKKNFLLQFVKLCALYKSAFYLVKIEIFNLFDWIVRFFLSLTIIT